MGMGTETAIGAGLLVSLAGVRWGVAYWEKAKQKWWKDWDRVGEGLERDIKVWLISCLLNGGPDVLIGCSGSIERGSRESGSDCS